MTVPARSKSAFANWLVAQRKSRPGTGKGGIMTTGELRAALLTSRGFGMGHSTYAALESGSRKPTDEQYRHLTGFFGTEPPAEPEPLPEPAPSDLSALLARLDEQARVIDRLAAAIEGLTKGHEALVGAYGTALAELRSEREDDPSSASRAGTRP